MVGGQSSPDSEGWSSVVGLGSALSGVQALPKMHLLSLSQAACCHLQLFSLSSFWMLKKSRKVHFLSYYSIIFLHFLHSGKKSVVVGDMSFLLSLSLSPCLFEMSSPGYTFSDWHCFCPVALFPSYAGTWNEISVILDSLTGALVSWVAAKEVIHVSLTWLTQDPEFVSVGTRLSIDIIRFLKWGVNFWLPGLLPGFGQVT